MGLPNMKRNTDYFDIRSSKEGTEIEMIVYLRPPAGGEP